VLHALYEQSARAAASTRALTRRRPRRGRGYSQKKVSGNVECEIMHVIVEEARESYRWPPAPVPGSGACKLLAGACVCALTKRALLGRTALGQGSV